MTSQETLASQLIDASLAGIRLPRACPCDFGPDNRYRLEAVIGMGADSFVYRAVDRKLSADGFPSRVAIKIHGSGSSTLAEAVSARRVQNEHVVQIHDAGETDDGESYLVSELIEGGDLSDVEVPLEPRLACEIMIGAADGVQALHNAGLVHGDLKPQNILLTDRGVPKIADFDLATETEERRTGGNSAFCAPESLSSTSPCVPPNDIYALGGILYYLLTGRLPNGDSRDEIKRRLEAGIRPASPAIDPHLDRICLRALEPDHRDRYPSAAEFAEDLRRWLEHRPIPWIPTPAHRRAILWARRRPVRATVLISLVLLGTAATVFTLVQHERMVQIRASEAARAEQRAIELNEQTKATLRNLFLMASTQSARATSNPRDTIIPAMVWLDYLAGLEVVADDGTQIGLNLRIQRLEHLLAKLTADGRAEHIDARLAAYVLAYSYLQRESYERARQITETFLLPWRAQLDDHDPVAITIETMHLVTRTFLNPDLSTEQRRTILRDELRRVSRIEDCRDATLLLQAAIEGVTTPADSSASASSS